MAEKTNDRYLEIFLVLIILSLGAVLYWMDHARVVVLYLFFLPVVLAGFYLGKYSAGVFAFLSVIISTIVIFGDIGNFSGQQTPIVVALTLMIWGAVLGLTAIFIGTLNEEKNSKVIEI
ncbi:MAG: hypothetical protein KDA80_04760, partial [Planctomycetaceae bacterium]|nr:hypothetical protein [Planctomycetaceae bacterium]